MQTIHTILKTAVIFLGLCASTHAADRLTKLNDAQLDSIAAGYLAIEVYAAAEAFGPVTETFTSTNAVVRQLADRDDGYTYTKGKGTAVAYARGSDVYTHVEGLINTDEEIVSISIIYKEKRYKPGKHKKRNKHARRNNRHNKKPRLKTEKSILRIRVLTRTPTL